MAIGSSVLSCPLRLQMALCQPKFCTLENVFVSRLRLLLSHIRLIQWEVDCELFLEVFLGFDLFRVVLLWGYEVS